jgi:predicted nuclease of predicted toxin-antitoxin system
MTFLVDVNLPGFLWRYKTDEFIFVSDTNKKQSDTEIWRFAMENNYTILTRDMDFYYKAKQSIDFPKIIIFRFGNLKLNAIHQYFDQYWTSICELIQENKLIFAWTNELEVIY